MSISKSARATTRLVCEASTIDAIAKRPANVEPLAVRIALCVVGLAIDVGTLVAAPMLHQNFLSAAVESGTEADAVAGLCILPAYMGLIAGTYLSFGLGAVMIASGIASGPKRASSRMKDVELRTRVSNLEPYR